MISYDMLITILLIAVVVPYWIGLAMMNSLLARHKRDQNPTAAFFISLIFGSLAYLYLLGLPSRYGGWCQCSIRSRP